MANSLSLTGSDGNLGIFECPVCKQTIDASAEKCRFCSATVDRVAAQIAAQKLSKINQACSDASFLRTAAMSLLVFLGVIFIPFMGLLGAAGYYFLLFAIPFLVIRWWLKFHSIRTEDSDFKRARITVIVISVLIVIPILLYLHRFF
jgi:hypothetical protein